MPGAFSPADTGHKPDSFGQIASLAPMQRGDLVWRLLTWCVRFAVVAAVLALLPANALASHGRYWNLYWTLDTTDPTNRTVVFHFTYAWATGFYGADNVVGSVVTTDSLDFGDGKIVSIDTRILSVNAAQGWSYGQAVTQVSPGVYVEGITHKYLSNGTFTANVASCCRWAGLSNTFSGDYRVETTVTPGSGNQPPVSSLPPIVQVRANTVATFTIPAIDPNLDTITFRLATDMEASGFLGGFNQPKALSVNANSGLVTWDITAATNPTVSAGQYYCAQIMMEDRDALGNVKSKTPVDFILQVVAPGANAPPVFDTPPTPIVATGPAGVPMSFVVQASDPNGTDTIATLLALNPPAGMTVVPIVAGPSPNPNAKAVLVTWTPLSNQTVIVVFQATDGPGGLTTFQAVTINGPVPPPRLPSGPPGEGNYAGARGPTGSEGGFGNGGGGYGFNGGGGMMPGQSSGGQPSGQLIGPVPEPSGDWRVYNVAPQLTASPPDGNNRSQPANVIGWTLLAAAALLGGIVTWRVAALEQAGAQ